MAANTDTKHPIPTTANKVLKWILLAVGLIAAVVAIYFVVRISWDMQTVMGYANANKSTEVPAPMPLIYAGIGVAALAGLLLGLGLGIPRRSARFIRKEALEGARPAPAAAPARFADVPSDEPRRPVFDGVPERPVEAAESWEAGLAPADADGPADGESPRA